MPGETGRAFEMGTCCAAAGPKVRRTWSDNREEKVFLALMLKMHKLQTDFKNKYKAYTQLYINVFVVR